MTRSVLLSLFVVPPAVAAVMAGCSDDPESSPIDPGVEAGVDAPSPADTGTDSGVDCKADIAADGLARHLECAGLYSSFAQKTIASDAKEYKPGVEFWSDGAVKRRWVSLPANTKIDTANMDEWMFPAGTKLWKEFSIGGKRIETRLYQKIDANNWAHTVYRWNDSETDAVRKDQGETITGLGLDGGAYEIPSTGQCDVCHNGRKEPVLGFEAVSLGLATATGVTLSSLTTEGRLTAAPAKTAVAFPEDQTAKAASAIGWVHANCGSCHNENESAGAVFRAHFLVRASDLGLGADAGDGGIENLDLWTQAYCKSASRPAPDGGGTDGGLYYLIKGGAPDLSLMAVLAGQRAPAGEEPTATNQMPPLVTHAVDVEGLKLFTDWIAALPACP